VAAIDVFTLTDGGQAADDVARRAAAFIAGARHTLELALYDVRLPDQVGEIVAGALREAAALGVSIRLVYNVDSERPPGLHPPPRTRPDILAELPLDARAVPGIPDLMHHKYLVRDQGAVWTGSANWTADSWTRQENVVAIVESEPLARAYRGNFEELWQHQDVERSGRIEPKATDVAGARVQAWFTPGQGEELSQAIATAIGRARRVRIASPVITSGPILGTLAEIGADGHADVAGVVDEPQTDTVFEQWRENGQSAWKIPLLATALEQLPFSGKPSTPWTPDSVHDFMHAKVTVADDLVFLGSFNLSRSGEMNAENVLEIRDRGLAGRMAAFVDEIRARYPPTTIPEHAAATIFSGSSRSSAISRSAAEMRPSPSRRSRIQPSSPDQ
jgi:phosphatidylserine/phosphatidylglycerophosphate/cardiolipin synthase-like enzyme